MKLKLLAEERYKSAVAVVTHGNSILLGRSTADDDRKGKLCFPAGAIEEGETPEQAAVRECQEETGYKVEAASEAFGISEQPDAAFVHCRLVGGKSKPNEEFTTIGWMPYDQAISSDEIYPANLKVLKVLKAQTSL